ncbi:hypothetical protein BSL78_19090 [Apostichopus japonicus]|uniref:Uncharacterized protein n=1 Tax=Stichopus japonicus TaxID=307972 RepID=A0A2G8K7R4_STIJA|nr:hypothetical protein BSL78_19090 [Apostichopus japonicus]
MGAGIHLDKDYVPSGGGYRRFESKENDSHRSNFRRHAKVHSFMDKLKIFFTNARSIRKNFAEFTVLLGDLKPDVFGITEYWLREDIDNAEVSHPGYVVYRQDRRDTHNGVGGGVLLYFRDDIVSVENLSCKGLNSVSKEKVPDFARSDTVAIETLLKGTDWINLFSDMSASSLIFVADKLKVIMEIMFRGRIVVVKAVCLTG